MTWQKIEFLFAFAISTFFFCEYSKQNFLRETLKDKVLNLADYKGIERSDLYLLQDISNNVKYKEIAKRLTEVKEPLEISLEESIRFWKWAIRWASFRFIPDIP